MSGNRRQQKKKDREKRVREKQLHDQVRHRYPAFDLENTHLVPEDFVRAVKQALQTAFTSMNVLSDLDRQHFSILMKYGSRQVDWMKEKYPHQIHTQLLRVGDKIFQIIGKEALQRWLPINDFELDFVGTRLKIKFRALEKTMGPWGALYYSPKKPSVTVGNKVYRLAWSDHAIRRTCDRIALDWLEYGPFGYVFSFFYDQKYYQPKVLPSGIPSVSMFDVAVPGIWERNHVEIFVGMLKDRKIAGKDPNAQKHITYLQDTMWRIGYCPLVVEGEFAKAKTLLIPGYQDTPEYSLILRAPPEKRKELLAKTNNVTYKDFMSLDYLKVYQWFEEQGIPQHMSLKGHLDKYEESVNQVSPAIPDKRDPKNTPGGSYPSPSPPGMTLQLDRA